MNEEMARVSMSIILHAGNARTKIFAALGSALEGDFTLAQDTLAAAQEDMTEAHRAQTEKIQGEARGETVELSLLFIHAQDTLMTIRTEWNLAQQMIKMQKITEARISRLEATVANAQTPAGSEIP